MRKIIIGFSRPINIAFPVYSYAIRAVYRTPYSHVYLKFRSDLIDRDIIYESVGVGVRFVGFNYWNDHAEVVEEFSISITDEQYVKVMQFCVDNAGIDYGKMQAIGVYVADVLDLKQNPFKNGDDKEICSEIIGRLLYELGFIINKNFDLLTPKDIYKILTTQFADLIDPLTQP